MIHQSEAGTRVWAELSEGHVWNLIGQYQRQGLLLRLSYSAFYFYLSNIMIVQKRFLLSLWANISVTKASCQHIKHVCLKCPFYQNYFFQYICDTFFENVFYCLLFHFSWFMLLQKHESDFYDTQELFCPHTFVSTFYFYLKTAYLFLLIVKKKLFSSSLLYSQWNGLWKTQSIKHFYRLWARRLVFINIFVTVILKVVKYAHKLSSWLYEHMNSWIESFSFSSRMGML